MALRTVSSIVSCRWAANRVTRACVSLLIRIVVLSAIEPTVRRVDNSVYTGWGSPGQGRACGRVPPLGHRAGRQHTGCHWWVADGIPEREWARGWRPTAFGMPPTAPELPVLQRRGDAAYGRHRGPRNESGPDRRLRSSGPVRLSQHRARPKGFEPLTF